MLTLRQSLFAAIERFAAATDRGASAVATEIFNDGKRWAVLTAGGDLTTRTFEAAMQWLSDNWPEGADWPDRSRPSRRRPNEPSRKDPVMYVSPVLLDRYSGWPYEGPLKLVPRTRLVSLGHACRRARAEAAARQRYEKRRAEERARREALRDARA